MHTPDPLTQPVQRPRRAVLAAAAGGLGAFIAGAFGRAVPSANAAAGSNLVVGANNSSGTSQTVLTSAAGGASFTLKDTATAGTGIFGWSSAVSGAGRGLYGRADSIDGFGIQAKNLAIGGGGTGAAIDATADYLPAIRGSSPVKGVHGISANAGVHGESTSGFGVLGTNTTGTGVRGTSSSGFAIYGTSSSSIAVFGNSGSSEGVRGISDTTHGVHGQGATSGVWGESTAGSGVKALSTSGYGVLASSSSGIALYGNSATNWSVLAEIDARVNNDFQVGGNQSVAGSLSKGGGSFRIDHPLDPANKYLSHSFVESPDMLNVYNGIATLDARGRATIRMPAWFDALNRDFRYQLTALDAAAPDLHVSVRMRDGRFSIAGGGAGQEVSWQVTGIRQDKWANANRIQVEEAKTGKESGTYLHPEIHGQPASRRVPAKHPLPKLSEVQA